MNPRARNPLRLTSQPRLALIINALTRHYNDRIDAWWPFETTLEIVVGAFLTQNTSWKNAEKAITNLKQDHALALAVLADPAKTTQIEACIKPAGYFRQKTRNLHDFAKHILEHHEDIGHYLAQDPQLLREDLLSRRGIGPETADTILLYAAGYPSFVVDAYTIRILRRLGVNEDAKYSTVQQLLETALPRDRATYERVHAAFVEHAKTYCKKTTPICLYCPITAYCKHYKS